MSINEHSQVMTIKERSKERSTGWEATKKQQYTGARNKEMPATNTECLKLRCLSKHEYGLDGRYTPFIDLLNARGLWLTSGKNKMM